VILAACSVTGNLEQLQSTAPKGTPFTQALAKEYQKFAEFEAYMMKDWMDQDHFATKGLRAAKGELVLPEELANWDIPADKVDELANARSRLIKALDAGGRGDHPTEAAIAQAKFDCWVEQQEENHQLEHIAACKREFLAAMLVLETAAAVPEPEPAPAPEPTTLEPAKFMVFFDWDSATVIDEANALLDLVIDRIGDYKPGQIDLVGHTDTSGPSSYNDALSSRRASNVRDRLIDLGVEESRLSVDAKGESEPLVETGDGVRSPQNRRVEITVR